MPIEKCRTDERGDYDGRMPVGISIKYKSWAPSTRLFVLCFISEETIDEVDENEAQQEEVRSSKFESFHSFLFQLQRQEEEDNENMILESDELGSAVPRSAGAAGSTTAKVRNTTPYLTKYERARVLGTRALHIRCAILLAAFRL